MKRRLATLVFCFLGTTAQAQMGSAPVWPPTWGQGQPTAPGTQPQPYGTQQPGQPTQPGQTTTQPAAQPAAPIFPAPSGTPGATPGTTPQTPGAAQPVAPGTAPGAQPAATTPAPTLGTSVAPQPAPFDYSINLRSEVFGARMFTGSFLQSTASLFNPDYVVAIGDQLQVRLWGAYTYDAILTVDAQGNVFLPQVGPVRVAGVANRELPKAVEEAMRRTFKSNVFSYVSLAAAQPVRVYVTGFVNRPGMYQGTSTDSVLRYLDQAGGIDPDRGSFLDVRVQRGSLARGEFNLYDFLLRGRLPAVQLADGDVVVVAPRKRTYIVTGLAENTRRFEFMDSPVEMSRIVELARPFPLATHMRVTRNTGTVANTEYYALAALGQVKLENGDQVDFTSDRRPGTISVRVEGEHLSPQEYSLPYGSKLADVLKLVKLSERADPANMQLFRLSVQERQNVLLQNALKALEQSVLTTRSGTNEEAQLRKTEADLVLNWTARARTVTPLGQVVIAQSEQRDELLLENGDRINIPVRDGLVATHGEILFPTTVAYDKRYVAEDYIKRSGGYSQNADTSRVIIAHRDGSFSENANGAAVRAGDDILVLPRTDTKSRQFWKDISQIIFQIAVSARIILGL